MEAALLRRQSSALGMFKRTMQVLRVFRFPTRDHSILLYLLHTL